MKKKLVSCIFIFILFTLNNFAKVVPFFPHLLQEEKIVLLLNDPDYEKDMAYIERALIDLDVKYSLFKTYSGEFPDPTSYDGLFVSGGAFMDNFIDVQGNIKKGGQVILQTEVPVLGICMGAQVIGKLYGSKLSYLPAHKWSWVRRVDMDPILSGMPYSFQVWENHDYGLSSVPEKFKLLIQGVDGSIQLMRHENLPLYAVQFHPAVLLGESETTAMSIVKNFLEMCGVKTRGMTSYEHRNVLAEENQLKTENNPTP